MGSFVAVAANAPMLDSHDGSLVTHCARAGVSESPIRSLTDLYEGPGVQLVEIDLWRSGFMHESRVAGLARALNLPQLCRKGP